MELSLPHSTWTLGCRVSIFPYLTEKFLYYLSVLPHRMNQDVLHCLVPSLGQGHMEVYLWGYDTVGREEKWRNQPISCISTKKLYR